VITTALVLAPLTQAAAQPHVVKRGETLSSIARSHRVSLGSLTAANSLRNPHALRPGQRLAIPGSQTPRQAVDSRTPSRATTHVVKPRETLSRIASRYRVSIRELAAVNGINNPDALQRGQRLVIPGPETRTVLPPLRVVGASAIPSRGQKWASAVVASAMRHMGVRYRWGGMSPRGFDCSGLIGYVMRSVGVRLPRTAAELYVSGRPVSTSELRVGDIVFFETTRPGPSHAGIYIGNDQFIHASSGFGRVTVTSMDYPYYRPRYLGARRF
ncbi:MAG: NlpC/P60 family protein, partial [bacterium]